MYYMTSSGVILNSNKVPLSINGKSYKRRTPAVPVTPPTGNIVYLTKQGDGGAIIGSGSGINPGDTVVVRASENPWNYIYFGGVHGTSEAPINIINEGDVLLTNQFTLEDCSYVNLSGTGTRTGTYGFKVQHTFGSSNAPGIGVKGISHHINVEYVDVDGAGYVIWVKNEVGEYTCQTQYWYPAMLDTITMRHLRGTNIWQDGFYIGSSDPYGKFRAISCNGAVAETFAMPTSHPTTMDLTVLPGMDDFYLVGRGFRCDIDGSNAFYGIVNSYNDATGVVNVTTTGHYGSQTTPTNAWVLNMNPRPTGLSNITIHDCILYQVGRSGIQWGGTTAGVNKIYNCNIQRCGFELNDQQGCGIAFGSASIGAEIYNNYISETYKNSFFSYHYGDLYLHDNTFLKAGDIPEGQLPYGMSSIFINPYDGALDPDTTRFRISNNTMADSTDTTNAIAFAGTTDHYGPGNYIDGNTFNGSPVTNSQIYKPGGIPSLSWSLSYP